MWPEGMSGSELLARVCWFLVGLGVLWVLSIARGCTGAW